MARRYARRVILSPLVPLVRIRRWTRMEYERLMTLGLVQPDERLELLDGQMVLGEPQGARHAAAVRRVLEALHRTLGDAWQIDSHLPLALDEDSEPEPDVAVVPRDPRAYRDGHPTGAALIVEIADASYRIDHAYKANLYARAGVPEYWIVDLARETLEVHREPQAVMSAPPGWRYLSLEVLRPPATISSLLAPTTSIPVADLLP